MTFTTGEKRLLILYHSGSACDTAAVLRDALRDTYDPDERAAALSALRKLENMSELEFENYVEENGVLL